jgi:hypothetical protein
VTVNANDLLASVRAVQNIAKCEADWRGVCARAYYAIYQDGKAFHDALPSPGRVTANGRGGKHADLIEQLSNPTIPRSNPNFLKSMMIGSSMETIYGNRIKSDYHRSETIDKTTAANSVLLAASILNTLAPPPPLTSPNRPTLTIIK